MCIIKNNIAVKNINTVLITQVFLPLTHITRKELAQFDSLFRHFAVHIVHMLSQISFSVQLSATLPHRKPLKRSPNRNHGMSPPSSAGASPVHSRRGSLTANSSNNSNIVSSSAQPVPAPVSGSVDRNHNVESVVPVPKKQEPKHNG